MRLGCDVTDTRPISEYEIAVVSALRRLGYRSLTIDVVTKESKVKRRTAKHHLARLVDFGVVEAVDLGRPEVMSLPAWRWKGPETHGHVARLRQAARARGGDLPPVGEPPERCDEGHDLTDPDVGYTWDDGYVGCIECGEVIMEPGIGAVPWGPRRSECVGQSEG